MSIYSQILKIFWLVFVSFTSSKVSSQVKAYESQKCSDTVYKQILHKNSALSKEDKNYIESKIITLCNEISDLKKSKIINIKDVSQNQLKNILNNKGINIFQKNIHFYNSVVPDSSRQLFNYVSNVYYLDSLVKGKSISLKNIDTIIVLENLVNDDSLSRNNLSKVQKDFVISLLSKTFDFTDLYDAIDAQVLGLKQKSKLNVLELKSLLQKPEFKNAIQQEYIKREIAKLTPK